jgi:hypothetical protein
MQMPDAKIQDAIINANIKNKNRRHSTLLFPMCYDFGDAVKALLAHHAPSADEGGSDDESSSQKKTPRHEASRGRLLMANGRLRLTAGKSVE